MLVHATRSWSLVFEIRGSLVGFTKATSRLGRYGTYDPTTGSIVNAGEEFITEMVGLYYIESTDF